VDRNDKLENPPPNIPTETQIG